MIWFRVIKKVGYAILSYVPSSTILVDDCMHERISTQKQHRPGHWSVSGYRPSSLTCRAAAGTRVGYYCEYPIQKNYSNNFTTRESSIPSSNDRFLWLYMIPNWRNVTSRSSVKNTKWSEKTPEIFVNLNVNTLLCTIHDIFGYRVPHVDVDMTYDGFLRIFKFLTSGIVGYSSTR